MSHVTAILSVVSKVSILCKLTCWMRGESDMRKIWETAVILIGTLGFWGFVYPELTMPMETYELVEETHNEPIRIKSRVMEYLYQVKEQPDREKD